MYTNSPIHPFHHVYREGKYALFTSTLFRPARIRAYGSLWARWATRTRVWLPTRCAALSVDDLPMQTERGMLSRACVFTPDGSAQHLATKSNAATNTLL